MASAAKTPVVPDFRAPSMPGAKPEVSSDGQFLIFRKALQLPSGEFRDIYIRILQTDSNNNTTVVNAKHLTPSYQKVQNLYNEALQELYPANQPDQTALIYERSGIIETCSSLSLQTADPRSELNSLNKKNLNPVTQSVIKGMSLIFDEVIGISAANPPGASIASGASTAASNPGAATASATPPIPSETTPPGATATSTAASNPGAATASATPPIPSGTTPPGATATSTAASNPGASTASATSSISSATTQREGQPDAASSPNASIVSATSSISSATTQREGQPDAASSPGALEAPSGMFDALLSSEAAQLGAAGLSGATSTPGASTISATPTTQQNQSGASVVSTPVSSIVPPIPHVPGQPGFGSASVSSAPKLRMEIFTRPTPTPSLALKREKTHALAPQKVVNVPLILNDLANSTDQDFLKDLYNQESDRVKNAFQAILRNDSNDKDAADLKALLKEIFQKYYEQLRRERAAGDLKILAASCIVRFLPCAKTSSDKQLQPLIQELQDSIRDCP